MKNTLYILLILLIFSCREDYSNRNIEVIDIKNYEQREWKDLPKQIGGIDSLLLLENDSILLSQIDDIKFLNDKFYIRDWKNKQIVTFNNNGDFIASISKYGRGPSEYLDISDFDVDKQGNIYVIDGNKDNLIVYDYQGNSVRSEKLPFEIDLIKVVSPNNYLITISSWEEGEHKGKQIVSTDSLFNIIKTHSLYTQYYDDNMWLSSSYFKETENGVFFHRQINDSVYLFNNGNLDKIYLFDFGAQSIPLDDRKIGRAHV